MDYLQLLPFGLKQIGSSSPKLSEGSEQRCTTHRRAELLEIQKVLNENLS